MPIIYQLREKLEIIKTCASLHHDISETWDALGAQCGVHPNTLKNAADRGITANVTKALASLFEAYDFTTDLTWYDTHARERSLPGGKRVFVRQDSAKQFEAKLRTELHLSPRVTLGLTTDAHEMLLPDLLRFEIETSSQEFNVGGKVPLFLRAIAGVTTLAGIAFRLKSVRLTFSFLNSPELSILGASDMRNDNWIEIRDATLTRSGGARTGSWELAGSPTTGLAGEYLTSQALGELADALPQSSFDAIVSVDLTHHDAVVLLGAEQLPETARNVIKAIWAREAVKEVQEMRPWRILGLHRVRVVPHAHR